MHTMVTEYGIHGEYSLVPSALLMDLWSYALNQAIGSTSAGSVLYGIFFVFFIWDFEAGLSERMQSEFKIRYKFNILDFINVMFMWN